MGNNNINKIISFKISGMFAHFRKFYTNASSLSYLIPPRSTLVGMLASMLKIPRDDYYELLSEDAIKVSVSIPEGLRIRKQTQSMNYFHNKYFSLLSKGKGKFQHSQCKLELLMFPINGKIEYFIYVGSNGNNKIVDTIEEKIRNRNLGFGCYLGQRQFRADVEYKKTYQNNEVVFLEDSQYLDSVITSENFIDYELKPEFNIINEKMPIHFKKVVNRGKKGREPTNVKNIFFEREGKRISGKFRNCYKIGDNIISFY